MKWKNKRTLYRGMDLQDRFISVRKGLARLWCCIMAKVLPGWLYFLSECLASSPGSLSNSASWQAAEDGSGAWDPAAFMGALDGRPGFWLQPDQPRVVKLWIEDISACVCVSPVPPFQVDKNLNSRMVFSYFPWTFGYIFVCSLMCTFLCSYENVCMNIQSNFICNNKRLEIIQMSISR